MQPGERITWRHVPKGGYGYGMAVPARFVRWGGWDKVHIEVRKADGEIVRRTVVDAKLFREADGVCLVALRREAVAR